LPLRPLSQFKQSSRDEGWGAQHQTSRNGGGTIIEEEENNSKEWRSRNAREESKRKGGIGSCQIIVPDGRAHAMIDLKLCGNDLGWGGQTKDSVNWEQFRKKKKIRAYWD